MDLDQATAPASMAATLPKAPTGIPGLDQITCGRDADGRPTNIVGVHLDITGRRNIEEALREGERYKNEFLATLAHELRNPLAAISSAVRITRAKGVGDADRRWAEDVIDRQMNQLARLMDDLLDLSRIAQGKIDLRPEPIGLRGVVENAAAAITAFYEKCGCALSVEFPGEPLWVDGDTARLQQVFTNLLVNAAKFNNAGGSVSVQVARDGSDAAVTVSDTGIGIAPEALANVFGLFVQVPSSPKPSSGLGIGLALVRSLVELHGGSVTAHSEGVGRGSTFVVRLPLTRPPPDRGAMPASAERLGDRCRVLVVDDNEDAARALSFLLADGGYDTAPRLLEPHIRLLALSGYGGPDEVARSLESGFHEHLVKPVQPDRLLNLIRARNEGSPA